MRRFLVLTIPILLLGGAFVLLVELLQLAAPPGAAAASAATTITVTTLDDELMVDGDCALREAVHAINTGAGFDTCALGSAPFFIQLPAGTITLTIPGTGENGNAQGDIDIRTSLTISGANTTIVAGPGYALGIDRIFHVLGAGTSVAMHDIALLYGTEPSGGAIFMEASTALRLRRVRLAYNAATNGGAIFISNNAHLEGERLSFLRNRGSAGGAIFYHGNASLFAVNFIANRALHGGGLYGDGQVEVRRGLLVGNTALGDGGAVHNSGVVNLLESTVAQNVGDSGGGIYNNDGLTLRASTVAYNTARFIGGGVHNQGVVLSHNSTWSGNRAVSRGGALFNASGTVRLEYSTMIRNWSLGGGAIYNHLGTTLLTASLVAASGGGNCAGGTPVTSNNYNLEDANSCNLIQPADQPNTPPGVFPLADNGGPTPTHLPALGSAPVDAADAILGVTVDQRTFARPVGLANDTGSVEVGHACFARVGAGPVFSSSDAWAIQHAVDLAPPGSLVKVAGICVGVQQRAGLTQTVYISRAITVEGGYLPTDWIVSDPVARHTLLSAHGRGRVLALGETAVAEVRNLTMIRGSAAGQGGSGYGDSGGAIYIPFNTTLTLDQVLVSSSQATVGGGIFSNGHLKVSHSTVAHNVARDRGGGLFITGPGAGLENSTVSGNRAETAGGGVFIDTDTTMNLAHATVAVNDAANGQGIANTGTTHLRRSALLHRTSDCWGIPPLSQGHNTARTLTCALAGVGDLQGVNPALLPLSNYGGPTPTHHPQAGSPLIDTAPCANPAYARDQRGAPRPLGIACDRGAVEARASPTLHAHLSRGELKLTWTPAMTANYAPGPGATAAESSLRPSATVSIPFGLYASTTPYFAPDDDGVVLLQLEEEISFVVTPLQREQRCVTGGCFYLILPRPLSLDLTAIPGRAGDSFFDVWTEVSIDSAPSNVVGTFGYTLEPGTR